MGSREYKYEFTPLAEQDLHEIFDYISLELSAPRAADKLIDNIQKAVNLACAFPFARPLLRNGVLKKKGYRLIVVQSFCLFYVVEVQKLIIRRVLYGKRDYENLL
jgi:addiction module RelE/StbE family toxin